MPNIDIEALKAVTVGENEKHGLRRIKDYIYEGWLEAANSMEADFGSQTFRGTPFSSIPIEHKFILELRDAKAEVERLRGEIATAKRIGAAEELLFVASKIRAFIHFREGYYGDGHKDAMRIVLDRAAELRKEAE